MSVPTGPSASYVTVLPSVVAVPPFVGTVTEIIVSGSRFASESTPFPLSANTSNELPDVP